jgi:PTS system nitrogen regulatory IIA component
MDIKHLLSQSNALVDVRASEKRRLLEELCVRAAKSLAVDGGGVARDILKREELGSTGVGGGIAIPHARVAKINAPFGIIARLRRPIDFEAIDGRAVDIVFLLLLPSTSSGDQLNALAAVARRLRDANVVRELREAPDGSSLYRALVGSD